MIKVIIFDFDGVLIDSINNMKFAWKNSCKKCGIKVSFNDYKKYIGLPFNKILSNLKIDKKKFLQVTKSYNFFSTKKIHLLKLSKKNTYFLKSLIKKGYILSLFTSKNRKRSNLILGNNKKLFKHRVFPSKNLRGKPYPDGIKKILSMGTYKKNEVIYLGDTEYDYLCAKNARIKYIHANWGYQKIKIKKVRKINKLTDLKGYLNSEK